ncbi:MAG: hypothetical protein V7707_01430 [Motiliproteus sp.]
MSIQLSEAESKMLEQIEQLKQENAQIRAKLDILQKQVDILFTASPNVSNKHVV